MLALLSALLVPGRAEALRPALRTYGVADGLKYSQVFCVVEDREGMVWAGTSYGVSRYDGRRFSSLTSRDGLPHDSVSALAVTSDGMGSSSSGSLSLPAALSSMNFLSVSVYVSVYSFGSNVSVI